MNNEHPSKKDADTFEKLNEVIQKKKEEIAGLQRLLISIENPIPPETDQSSDPNEKDNNSKSSE